MRMPPIAATRNSRNGGDTTAAEQRLDDPWQNHSSWSRASPRKKSSKSVPKQRSTTVASRSTAGRKGWSSEGWTTVENATKDAGWPATTKNNEWGSAVDLQSNVSDEQQWNAPSGSGDDVDDYDDEDGAWKINRNLSVPPPRSSPVTTTTSSSPRMGSIERPIPVLQPERMEGSTTPTHRNHHHSGSFDFVTRLRQEHDEKDWQQQQEEERERDVLQRAAEKRASTPTSSMTRPSHSGGSGGRRFSRRQQQQQQHEALVNSDEEESFPNGKQRKGLLRFFGGVSIIELCTKLYLSRKNDGSNS